MTCALSDDPEVKRSVPKLLNSISRAVNLCESTLAFGKAEEPPPSLDWFPLTEVIDDVLDSERVAAGESDVTYHAEIPAAMTIRADPEQLYRVLSNLVRNARQAIIASRKPGEIMIRATEGENDWTIVIEDTGPGLPAKARDFLFQPFQGGTRKGGHGLGLAIAAELVRGHGGRLDLEQTGEAGTRFVISLPKSVMALEEAAE